MADKSTPDAGANESSSVVSNGAKGTNDAPNDAGAQVSFDDRFDLFMGRLKELCEIEHVEVAVAIICDPKFPGKPILFSRGHTYDIGQVMARVLRSIKSKLFHELET